MIVCVKLRRALLDDDLRHQLPDPIAPREKEWCLDLGWKRKPRVRMVLVSRCQHILCRPCSASPNQRPREITRQTKLCARAVGILARPPPHWYLWPCGLRGLGVSDESLCWLHAATQPIPRVAGALFYWDGTGWESDANYPKPRKSRS